MTIPDQSGTSEAESFGWRGEVEILLKVAARIWAEHRDALEEEQRVGQLRGGIRKMTDPVTHGFIRIAGAAITDQETR